MTMVYISTTTLSQGSSATFTVDSSYDIYEFHYVGMRGERAASNYTGFTRIDFGINFSTSVPRTTTWFRAKNSDFDTTTTGTLQYEVNAFDADSDYGRQIITESTGVYGLGSGPTASGVLTVYEPASTNYMKHFSSRSQTHYDYSSQVSTEVHTAGYYMSTSAATSVTFGVPSPHAVLLSGTIHMYGLK